MGQETIGLEHAQGWGLGAAVFTENLISCIFPHDEPDLKRKQSDKMLHNIVAIYPGKGSE